MKLVLFLNMGGATSPNECKIFLKNMFNDPYILPIKSPKIRALIAFLITQIRTPQMQKNYAKIGGKSPLNEITQNLCDKLNEKFNTKNSAKNAENSAFDSKNSAQSIEKTQFDFINTYVPPFAKDVLDKYEFSENDEIVLFPLYPHYSQTTVKSALNCVFNELENRNSSIEVEIENGEKILIECKNKIPAKVRTIDIFYENEAYNALIIKHILEAKAKFRAQTLIFSAHSLPVRTIKRGDPYEKHIKAHFELLKTRLSAEFSDIELGFQSRLGPVKWLGPNTSDILARLHGTALIYPLSFCIDCSESVFELDIEYRKIAPHDYRVISCPNSSVEFVEFVEKLL